MLKLCVYTIFVFLSATSAYASQCDLGDQTPVDIIPQDPSPRPYPYESTTQFKLKPISDSVITQSWFHYERGSYPGDPVVFQVSYWEGKPRSHRFVDWTDLTGWQGADFGPNRDKAECYVDLFYRSGRDDKPSKFDTQIFLTQPFPAVCSSHYESSGLYLTRIYFHAGYDEPIAAAKPLPWDPIHYTTQAAIRCISAKPMTTQLLKRAFGSNLTINFIPYRDAAPYDGWPFH